MAGLIADGVGSALALIRFLFGSSGRQCPMVGSALTTTGSENMEGFGCPDCWGFSSIMREVAN